MANGDGGPVATKRIYEPASPEDGYRVLVDRIWPRGLTKEEARLDEWLREVAPSNHQWRWFDHDPRRWDEFRQRYRAELAEPERREIVAHLHRRMDQGRLTLLDGARDIEHNQAVALAELLREEQGA